VQILLWRCIILVNLKLCWIQLNETPLAQIASSRRLFCLWGQYCVNSCMKQFVNILFVLPLFAQNSFHYNIRRSQIESYIEKVIEGKQLTKNSTFYCPKLEFDDYTMWGGSSNHGENYGIGW